MKLTIAIHGQDEIDLDDALNEIKRLVAEAYLSGANSNETGSYEFTLEGVNEAD